MVAQLVEQLPLKQLVLGSSPSHSTTKDIFEFDETALRTVLNQIEPK